MMKAFLVPLALFLSVYASADALYGPPPAPSAAAVTFALGSAVFRSVGEAIESRVSAVYVHQGDTWYYADQGKAPRVRGRKSRTLWVTLAFDDGSHALLTFRNVKTAHIDRIYRATTLVHAEQTAQSKGDAIAAVGEVTAQARLQNVHAIFEWLGSYSVTMTGSLMKNEKVTSVFASASDSRHRLTARHAAAAADEG